MHEENENQKTMVSQDCCIKDEELMMNECSTASNNNHLMNLVKAEPEADIIIEP